MRVKIVTSRPVAETVRDFLSRAVRGKASPVAVQRRQLPYWQERGWTRSGNRYTGAYRTPYGAFTGEIIEHRGSDIDFFLYQPSEAIRSCGHWACFQDRGNDWYLVHMGKRPRDVSSGIIAIERLITEAYQN